MRFWRRKEAQAELPAPPTLREHIRAQFPKGYDVKQDDLEPNQFIVEHGWTNIACLTITRKDGEVSKINGKYWDQSPERAKAIMFRFVEGLNRCEASHGRTPIDVDVAVYSQRVM